MGVEAHIEAHMRKLHGFSTWSYMQFSAHYQGKSWKEIHDRDHQQWWQHFQHFHEDGSNLARTAIS
jgi:hypothetical protein